MHSLLLALLLAQTIELASPTIATAPGYAGGVRVAGTATESLAIWIDSGALHAIRVDLLGRALDERSIVLASDDVSSAEVATDGRDYLIAYSTCSWEDSDCAAHFATIAPDGAVFQSRQRMKGVRVESLAWTGERYVLAYHIGSRDPIAATLAILDRRGFVLEDRIQPTKEPIYYVDLAGDGAGGIALVWAGPIGSGFATGSLDDMRRGALVPVRLVGAYYPLSVAASPSGFVVGGEDLAHGTRTILLSRSGVITNANSSFANRNMVVGATSATRFGVFFEPTPGAYELGLRMQPFDRAMPAVAVVPELTTWGFAIDVATTADGGAVFGWSQEIRTSLRQVRIVRVAPSGTLLRAPGAIEPVNRGFVRYEKPVVRRCGDTFVTAWVELSDRGSVRFRRVTSSGVPLDPPSRRVTSLSPNHQDWPGVACTGDSMLITWLETAASIRVGRGLLITASGERLVEFGRADDLYAVGVKNEYVVFRANPTEWHDASHWTNSGTQRTEWTQLFHQPCSGHGAVETNGEDLLVVTTNTCSPQDFDFVIARPYSPSLMTLRSPVSFQSISYPGEAHVAAAPDGWLVTWGSGDTYFGRIDRSFLGLDPRRGVFAGHHGPATASWNGATFEILGRDALVLVSMSGEPAQLEVPEAVARVASDGAGPRLTVTTERGEDGAMRVVGQLARGTISRLTNQK